MRIVVVEGACRKEGKMYGRTVRTRDYSHWRELGCFVLRLFFLQAGPSGALDVRRNNGRTRRKRRLWKGGGRVFDVPSEYSFGVGVGLKIGEILGFLEK